VRVGQRVQVTLDAVPERVFDGTIRYVSASVERNTRGLTVEAVIANPERLLRPGLFAAARIETGTTQPAAVIPAAAVLRQAGVNRVFVVADGAVQERVIAIGERRGDEVVVADGVRAGEKVVVGGLERLTDGTRVVEGS
jgi:membrane fusion protein (multidrug efflux system)